MSDSPSDSYYEPLDLDAPWCLEHCRLTPCAICAREQNGADEADGERD